MTGTLPAAGESTVASDSIKVITVSSQGFQYSCVLQTVMLQRTVTVLNEDTVNHIIFGVTLFPLIPVKEVFT